VRRVHFALAVVAAALAGAAALAEGSAGTPRFISATDLAARIMRREPSLRVFDLRSRDEFDRFHVAGASHVTVGALRREPLPRDATVVLYANGLARASRAWRIAEDRSAEAFVLRGGAQEWFVRVYEPRLAVDATAEERTAFEQAVPLSRFFGGKPLVDVPRSQLLAAATLRRRGC
jgi:rhodanese-related sulfurtransferase